MEAWVRQLFAGTEDFSTLTTKKVRLIYERETSQVLNSEEKRQLKEIIVKLLPDFLSHQSPRKSGDEDPVYRGTEGEEAKNEDKRVSKQKKSSIYSNTAEKLKSDSLVKENNNADKRGQSDVENDGEDDDADVVNGHDDIEGNEVGDGKEDSGNDHEHKLSSSSEEDSAEGKSLDKESENLSTDTSVVTSWKVKEAKSAKKYSGINKRPKRRVSVGEAMEKMDLKLKALKPCSVRLYDIRTESGSGSSGELLKVNAGRRLSLGEWRSKVKRKRVVSDSSGSGSDPECRGSSPKQTQKAKKIRKGSSSDHSSEENIQAFKTKAKISDSDDWESVRSDSDRTLRGESGSESGEDSPGESHLSLKNSSLLLGKVKTTRRSTSQKVTVPKKRKTIDSDSEENSSDDQSARSKRQRRSSVTRRKELNECESAKKPSHGKKSLSVKSNLPEDMTDTESDSDFANVKKAVSKTKRKTLSLESDDSDSVQSDSQARVSKGQERNPVDSSDESELETSLLTIKSGHKDKPNSKRSVTKQRPRQASDSVESSSDEEADGQQRESEAVLQRKRNLLGQSDDESLSKTGKMLSARVIAENIDSDLDSPNSVTVKTLRQAKKGSPFRRKLKATASSVRRGRKQTGRGGVVCDDSERDTPASQSGSASIIDGDSDSDSDEGKSILKIHGSTRTQKPAKVTKRKDSLRKKQQQSEVDISDERRCEEFDIKPCFVSLVDVLRDKSFLRVSETTFLIRNVVRSHKTGSKRAFCGELSSDDEDSGEQVAELFSKRSPGRKSISPTKRKTMMQNRKSRTSIESSSSSESDSDIDNVLVSLERGQRSATGGNVKQRAASESDSDFEPSQGNRSKAGESKSPRRRFNYSRDKSEQDSIDEEFGEADSGRHSSSLRGKKVIRDENKGKHGTDQPRAKWMCLQEDSPGPVCRSSPRKSSAGKQGIGKAKRRNISESGSDIFHSSDEGSDLIDVRGKSPSKTPRGKHKTDVIQSSDEGSALMVETMKSSNTFREKHKTRAIQSSDEESDLIAKTVQSSVKICRGKNITDVTETKETKTVIAMAAKSINKKENRASKPQSPKSDKKASKLQETMIDGQMVAANNQTDSTDSDSDSLPSFMVWNETPSPPSSVKQVQKEVKGSDESELEMSALVSQIRAKHLSPKSSARQKEESKLNLSSSRAPRLKEIVTDSDSASSEVESVTPRRRARERLSKKRAENRLKKQIQLQDINDTSSSVSDANDEPLNIVGDTCSSKRKISLRVVSDSESLDSDVKAASDTRKGKNRRENLQSHRFPLSSVESVKKGSSVHKAPKAVDEDLHNSDVDIEDIPCLRSSSKSPQKKNLSKQKSRLLQSRKTEKRNNHGEMAHRKSNEDESDEIESSNKHGRNGHSSDEYDPKNEKQNDVEDSDDSGNISPDDTVAKTSSLPSPSGSAPASPGADNSDISDADSKSPQRRASPRKHIRHSSPPFVPSPAQIHSQKGKLKKADYSDVDTSSLSESELQPITTKDQPVKVLKKKRSVNNSNQKVKQSKKTNSKKGTSKQKVKEAATDPYSEKLQELVTICKAMGLFYNHRVRGCNSAEEKVERIQDYLEEVGMKGEITLERARKWRLEREAGELSKDNILSSQEGRTRRSQGLFSSRSKSPRKPASPGLKLDRLRDIIDSEGSSD